MTSTIRRSTGVTYTCSTGNLLQRVKFGTAAADTIRMWYDGMDRDSVVRYPGDMRASFTYTADGLLAVARVRQGTSGIPQHLNNFTGYDGAGRPSAMSRSTFGNDFYSNSWAYNDRGHVTLSNWQDVVREYAYDASGNRAWEQRQGGLSVYQYYYGGTSGSPVPTLGNRLYRRSKLSGPPSEYGANYTYNDNGSLMLRSDIGRVRTVPYFYDTAQRLFTHNSTNLNDVQYRYDGLDRIYRARERIEELDPNAVRYFSHDGANIGSVEIVGRFEFVQRPGVDQPLVAIPTNVGPPCYLVTLGGRLITSHDGGAGVCTSGAAAAVPYSGAIVDSWSFEQERVGSWGLSFFRNRWYDSQTGRFTQEDPIGYAGGGNLYSYGGNAPAAYTDPFGLCPWCWAARAVAKVAGHRVANFVMGRALPALGAFGRAAINAIQPGAEPTAGPIRFAQRGISSTFRQGEFAGQTIDAVAAGLRGGSIRADRLPLNVITRNGIRYTLNNRSLMALRKAGLEPTVVRDVTGTPFFERQLTERLAELGEVGADFLPVIRRSQ